MNKKPSAINIIWLVMILSATVVAAYTGKMAQTTAASFDAAKSAVTLAIGLIGAMAFWLGIMKVVEVAGLMKLISRFIRPVMIRLFPEVPSDHPAMSAIIMNMAANALGLGNAATPMGIKAMQELDKLNPQKGTATNAMCLFLAINTSSVTLLPLGVITLRASAGASNPSAILITTLLATITSTLVAIGMAKFLAPRFTNPNMPAKSISNTKNDLTDLPTQDTQNETVAVGVWSKVIVISLITAFFGAIVYRFYQGNTPQFFSPQFFSSLSNWLIPVLISTFLLFGYFKGVKVYETLTDGAKEGFNIAIKIIPFMVAIFVAIGMVRASGALDIIVTALNPITSFIGLPAEGLSVALMRPLSGSGSFGIMAEIVNRDPDSFLSFLVSTMQGSTETTFYVLAVYFGSVGIKRTRYALPAALCADAAGVIASLVLCRLLF